jgi:hypothetical protein
MNGRLSLVEIAARLTAQLAGTFTGIKIGTSYDNDYYQSFGQAYPAVWVGAQRLTALDNGDGFTQQNRQHTKVEVVFRIIVQRFVANEANGAAEVRLNALCDAVSNAIKDWQPTGADQQFVWISQTDGAPNESVMVVDAIYSTTTTYARTS